MQAETDPLVAAILLSALTVVGILAGVGVL